MTKGEEKERKISFKCCIPRECSNCTDDELRLSMVTLKNAMVNITICLNRIERELKRRGASTSLIRNMRTAPSPELLEMAAIKG
ncbi:MAG: hypothetical protein EAX87_10930 [Candidatus Thorarchaeota archaeon]|nr:hypothetical protein [Candidatus Thorarchaeota archaeon]